MIFRGPEKPRKVRVYKYSNAFIIGYNTTESWKTKKFNRLFQAVTVIFLCEQIKLTESCILEVMIVKKWRARKNTGDHSNQYYLYELYFHPSPLSKINSF